MYLVKLLFCGPLLACFLLVGCTHSYDPKRADEAIAKAEAFLRARTSFPPGELAVVDYIGRKFHLAWANARIAAVDVNQFASDPWNDFSRLLKPDFLPPREDIFNRAGTIDGMSLTALYCDKYGLPGDYNSVLEKGFAGDDYWPTHTALAVGWAAENNCIVPKEYEQLRPTIRDAILRTITRHSQVDDIFAESIALLYYSGLRQDVQIAWLAKLVNAQLSDGGWSAEPFPMKSNSHTTVLALWGLLEARNPNAPRIKWVR